MSTGVFSSLSKSYRSAAGNGFRYVRQTHWIFWPIVGIVAIVYAIVLLPISVGFASLIIFDWIGYVTNKIRRTLLELMEKQSNSINDSFWSFLFRPILLVLISPLFFLSVFIPKLSSNIEGTIIRVTLSGGTFKDIKELIWKNAIDNLFSYVQETWLLLKPIAAIIAFAYSIVLIAVGAIFATLTPLDWVAWLIETVRQRIANFANRLQENIRYHAGAFLFNPVWLALLSPIFLIVILIPKFTTNIDVEA
ncbi:MAG: hypothetical protein BWK78_06505 [Thiotrichaceae bacterium IS1]|nr:MAG: hypothetical protein BWK78_06505 [Thiotrichaceae bacterium IS1]